MRRKIKRDVELRLKMAGIKVISAKEKSEIEENPKLSVRIILHEPGAPIR
jgi:hypothetical protein